MFRTALLSALVFAGVIGPASAETITVCASGCDFSSICLLYTSPSPRDRG